MNSNLQGIDELLGAGGKFDLALEGFVTRKNQQEMARAVADSIEFSGKLVVESGTGTGKTYAYLIPAVLSGKKTIISTGTRHLQEQIFHRDLPVVVNILQQDLQLEMLKGRANYLCRYRHKLNSQQSDLVGKQNQLSFDIIDNWALTTRTGDISEVTELHETSPIWKQVTSTSDNCLGGKCPDYARCFINQARKKAMEADVVVVNHHLFFSDLTLKTEGFGELLPEYEVVIFDEAHTLPDIAARFFGFSISNYQLRELFSDIHSAEKEEKSGADFKPTILLIDKNLDLLHRFVEKTHKDSEILEAVEGKKFDAHFEPLLTSLEQLDKILQSASSAGANLSKCYLRYLHVFGQLRQWRENRDYNHVSWLESSQLMIRFHQTPLNVGDHFGEYLNGLEMSWIFTSATLAVGDDFSAFCNKVGLLEVDTKHWESPFNYSANALLYIPDNMPDPRDRGFALSLRDEILRVTHASKGRCFCLFTSHAMMNRVFDLVKDDLKWPLFLQGQAAKQHLIQQFLEADNAVLFGTSSFWEGVDVRGDALSCVLIDKLPFSAPSEPVLKSQLKKCEEQGGMPFMDIQIPDAVIGLKQGAGRLIRSETDKGVLVICDARIVNKSYGKLFLKSLPPMPVTRNFEEVHNFFNR